METTIITAAVAFVQQQYGLDSPHIAAQVDAIQANGWQVTVWIGPSLFQRVVVSADGTVYLPGE